MAKRLKKVNIPKEPQKGPFTPPTAPAVLQPAVFDAPKEPSAFIKRLDGIRAAIKAKLEADKAAFGQPKPLPINPGDLMADTVIEGKYVTEWADQIEKYQEGAKGTVDLTIFPGWSVWAVEKWIANGRPTKSTKVLKQITEMREKAEELVKFAALDKEEAKSQPPVKAKKLVEAAQKKSDKAAKLFDEANTLAREHKMK